MDLEGNILFLEHDFWRNKELIYRGMGTAEEAAPILDMLERDPGNNQTIEMFSHIPEPMWRYGREDGALRALAGSLSIRSGAPSNTCPTISFAPPSGLVRSTACQPRGWR